jgi:hypothetical protein
MNKNITILTLVVTLIFGGLISLAPTTYAKNNKSSLNSNNNGLHLGWYKNGKISYSYTHWNNSKKKQNAYSYYAKNEEFQKLIEEFRTRIAEYLKEHRTYYNNTNTTEIDVFTRTAINIEDNRATLRGRIDFNDEDEATVYFLWGDTRTNLDEETSHVLLDDNDDENFEKTLTGLRNNETYYYRAVAEDSEGNKTYGTVYTFSTNDSDEDYPDVTTYSAQNIHDTSADLRGSIDMNDFNNGTVFFVYGEDEDQIHDVDEDFKAYSEIHEDGDDLQKTSVFDSNLDDTKSYTIEVTGLDRDTDHFFRLCVQFEDEDDTTLLVCGAIKSFTTDN